MAWTNSKVFRAMLQNFFIRTTNFAIDFDADSFKFALFDNDITPDNDATAANSAYNAGQWASAGNEVFEAGQWAQGGPALSGVSLDASVADTVFFDATDPASGSAADLANVFGGLCYDDTVTTPVADQGVCYNYFGGSNSVVNGTLTVILNANGLFRGTL